MPSFFIFHITNKESSLENFVLYFQAQIFGKQILLVYYLHTKSYSNSKI